MDLKQTWSCEAWKDISNASDRREKFGHPPGLPKFAVEYRRQLYPKRQLPQKRYAHIYVLRSLVERSFTEEFPNGHDKCFLDSLLGNAVQRVIPLKRRDSPIDWQIGSQVTGPFIPCTGHLGDRRHLKNRRQDLIWHLGDGTDEASLGEDNYCDYSKELNPCPDFPMRIAWPPLCLFRERLFSTWFALASRTALYEPTSSSVYQSIPVNW